MNYETWIYGGKGSRRNLYRGKSVAKAKGIMELVADVTAELKVTARVQVLERDLLEKPVQTIDTIDGNLFRSISGVPSLNAKFRLALDGYQKDQTALKTLVFRALNNALTNEYDLSALDPAYIATDLASCDFAVETYLDKVDPDRETYQDLLQPHIREWLSATEKDRALVICSLCEGCGIPIPDVPEDSTEDERLCDKCRISESVKDLR